MIDVWQRKLPQSAPLSGFLARVLPAAVQPVEERISDDARSVTSKSIAAELPK
jgi:hypothetical protein